MYAGTQLARTRESAMYSVLYIVSRFGILLILILILIYGVYCLVIVMMNVSVPLVF